MRYSAPLAARRSSRVDPDVVGDPEMSTTEIDVISAETDTDGIGARPESADDSVAGETAGPELDDVRPVMAAA